MAGDWRLSSDATIAQFKAMGFSQSLLAFSRGKDSIACALTIRDHVEVRPFHRAWVPGLSFVEESLDYYERKLFGGQHIIRMPHTNFYDQLDTSLFQTPQTAECLAAADMIVPSYEDLNDEVLTDLDWDLDTWTATGVRAQDSMTRQMAHRRYGAIRVKQRTWFPIAEMGRQTTLDMVSKAGLSLPMDYLMFGRTWDGLNAGYLIPIKKWFPDDYKRILEFFPLAEVEVWRYERWGPRHGA
jgi:hypothetical protein